MTLVFLDTETTSLRPDRRVWEVALIARHDDGREVGHHWFVDHGDLDLGNADLTSLKIGGFFERHPGARTDVEMAYTDTEAEDEVMAAVEVITRGATIVGAVPWFDTDVLDQRMRWHDLCPAWHYHLVDVETLAAGAMRQPPPWSFDQLLAAYGLHYQEADRHTALGDARMVRDLYDAVLGLQPRIDPICAVHT
jgi:DNA polymerase III epsilon subunit-like protein